MFAIIPAMLFAPHSAWRKLGLESERAIRRRLPYGIVMSLLPPFAFYWGATQVGWRIGGTEHTLLTPASALPLAVLFYCAVVGALVFIGFMVHWMSRTYRTDDAHPIRGIVLLSYAATPVFFASLFGLYPVWWFDLILATAACSYAVRLLYIGLPQLLHIPEDLGFLYASAVFLVVLVYVVMVMGATAILWQSVATPVFTN